MIDAYVKAEASKQRDAYQ
jgi:hypothetical protein